MCPRLTLLSFVLLPLGGGLGMMCRKKVKSKEKELEDVSISATSFVKERYNQTCV